jgi:hypothetical protein
VDVDDLRSGWGSLRKRSNFGILDFYPNSRRTYHRYFLVRWAFSTLFGASGAEKAIEQWRRSRGGKVKFEIAVLKTYEFYRQLCSPAQGPLSCPATYTKVSQNSPHTWHPRGKPSYYTVTRTIFLGFIKDQNDS